ncbi:MAG: hypothetical protein LBT22_02960, partial [Peptococcaceae bacterium]|nr:hypothetical protein [Peptococcaceae bacterium]
DNIPSFVGLAPKRIEISENNQLAYCKNSPYRDSASSEVVLADLNAGSKETVQRTDDVTSEWLYECSIFGDTIVWNKYSEPNDDFSFRMAQYKYSAIYSYDIPSKKTEALTGSQEFYDNPSLYENHLAMVKLPLTKPGQASSNAEIALMDLKTKSIEIVVDENSAIYLNKIDAAFPMTRSNPQITSRYITWWSTSDRARVYLYDYYQHTFVQMYDAPVNFDSTEIYRLFENAVILYETKLDDKGDSQSRTFYVSLE